MMTKSATVWYITKALLVSALLSVSISAAVVFLMQHMNGNPPASRANEFPGLAYGMALLCALASAVMSCSAFLMIFRQVRRNLLFSAIIFLLPVFLWQVYFVCFSIDHQGFRQDSLLIYAFSFSYMLPWLFYFIRFRRYYNDRLSGR